MILPKNEKIIIVGAGCFGVSTAYHLLRRGYTDITIIDRSRTLPAPDAASNDLNRSQFDIASLIKSIRLGLTLTTDR
jgi:sarcosine oxidase/L-pipecolate oxidase